MHLSIGKTESLMTESMKTEIGTRIGIEIVTVRNESEKMIVSGAVVVEIMTGRGIKTGTGRRGQGAGKEVTLNVFYIPVCIGGFL